MAMTDHPVIFREMPDLVNKDNLYASRVKPAWAVIFEDCPTKNR
ncbi:MAG: hypothetical protein AAFY25_04640 [Pseudomonadota bacterium]